MHSGIGEKSLRVICISFNFFWDQLFLLAPSDVQNKFHTVSQVIADGAQNRSTQIEQEQKPSPTLCGLEENKTNKQKTKITPCLVTLL